MNNLLRFIHISLFILFSLLSGYCLADEPGSEENSIQYINSEDAIFKAILEPDPSDGPVPVASQGAKELVQVQLDGNALEFSLNKSGSYNAEVNGSVPTIEEGKHKATIITLSANNSQKDKKDILFIYDITPPEVEYLGEEDTLNLPEIPGTLFFKVSDEGSGVDVDPEKSLVNLSETNPPVINKTLLLKKGELYLRLEFEEKNLNALLITPGSELTIDFSIQDRAHNITQYSKTFRVDESLFATTTKSCKQYGVVTPQKYITRNSVVSMISPLEYFMEYNDVREVPIADDIVIDLVGYLPSGEKIAGPKYGIGGTDFEFYYFRKDHWDIHEAISVTSESPLIKVTKGADNKTFSLSQTGLAPPGGNLAFVTVKSPVLIQSNNFQSNWTCERLKNDGYTLEEHDVSIEYGLRRLPVYLKQAPVQITNQIELSGEDLISSLTSDFPESIDIERAFFEVDGQKVWFERDQEEVVAKIPVKEGVVKYKTRYSLVGRTENETYVGDYLVKIEPPQIKDLKYNRTEKIITAKISDKGTLADDLKITLSLGGEKIPFQFDPNTGVFIASYEPVSNSTQIATLTVTDAAGQQSNGRVSFFGEIKPEEKYSTPTSVLYQDQVNPYKIVAVDTIGKSLKERAMKLSSGPSPYQINLNFGSGGGFGGSGYGTNPTISQRNFLKRLRQRAIVEDRTPKNIIKHVVPDKPLLPKTSVIKTSSDGYLIVRECRTYRYDLNGKLIVYYYPEDKGDFKSSKIHHETMQVCKSTKIDKLKPVIHDISYNVDSNILRAMVHDHGRSVRQVTVKASHRNDDNLWREEQLLFQKAGRNSWDGETQFQSLLSFKDSPRKDKAEIVKFYELPKKGESFWVRFEATDKANNTGWATATFQFPRVPPEVELKLVEKVGSGSSLRHNGQNISARFTTFASDESDFLMTKFWIDGEIIQPFSSGYSFDRRDELNKFEGVYGLLLEEGEHQSRFRAVDKFGLSAETTLDFTIEFIPVIHNFKETGKRNNGPLFTATIIDDGDDLNQSGISFFVNNTQIPASNIYYDPVSKYFAAYGPLEFKPGNNIVTLRAIDDHNNSATKILSLSVASDTIQNTGYSGVLKIGDYSIWEIENHNNDGFANPGEVIRLLIPLINETANDYESCLMRLSAEDERLVFETDTVLYEDIKANATKDAAKGIELNIGENILSETLNNPYPTTLHVSLECEDGGNSSQPDFYNYTLLLPVYRPFASPGEESETPITSIVNVDIDTIPNYTNDKELVITGVAESDNSTVEQIILTVNGIEADVVDSFDPSTGEFVARITLLEGNNLIDVTAIDTIGTWGRDFTQIEYEFIPQVVYPALEILTPNNTIGQQCQEIEVNGRFTLGSAGRHSFSFYVNDEGGPFHWIEYDDPANPTSGTFQFEASGRGLETETLNVRVEMHYDNEQSGDAYLFSISDSINVIFPECPQ